MRPGRSSSCQRVPTISSCEPLCRRVRAPALYHSLDALSRTSGELASSASSDRSSRISRSTVLPVSDPSRPTASRPPLCPARSNSSAVRTRFPAPAAEGAAASFLFPVPPCSGLSRVSGKSSASGSAVDQLLDVAVKARREPQVVRRERDAQAGADAQRIGGQQHRRAERLAVLRRYRDDQPPDEPFGKGVQGTVIGGVEGVGQKPGTHRRAKSGRLRLASSLWTARRVIVSRGRGSGTECKFIAAAGRALGVGVRPGAVSGKAAPAGAGRLRGVCGKGFVHRAGRGWS